MQHVPYEKASTHEGMPSDETHDVTHIHHGRPARACGSLTSQPRRLPMHNLLGAVPESDGGD